MDVGAADAAQRDVDDHALGRRHRRGKLAQLQLALPDDQPRVHHDLLDTSSASTASSSQPFGYVAAMSLIAVEAALVVSDPTWP